MAKAVLTTKVSPTYDDLPEVRYHFPRTYLNQVSSAVGYGNPACQSQYSGGSRFSG